MPRYDFKCRQCSYTFETELPFGSDEAPACTQCQGETERVIAPPAIHFKGEGFFNTDRRKEAKEAKESKGAKEKQAYLPAKEKKDNQEQASNGEPASTEQSRSVEPLPAEAKDKKEPKPTDKKTSKEPQK